MFDSETAKIAGSKGGKARKGAVGNNTSRAQRTRRWLLDRIEDDRERWYEALRAAGLGHFVGKELPGVGIVNVYLKSPNVDAIKEVLNRALGRVPQTLAIDLDPKEDEVKNYALDLIQPFLDPDDPEDAAFVIRKDIGEDEDGRAEEGVYTDIPAVEKTPVVIWDVLLPGDNQDGTSPDTPGTDRLPDQAEG